MPFGAIYCYACGTICPVLRQTVRISGDANEVKREIALRRRDRAGLPPSPILDESRLCFTCHISISEEITLADQNPASLLLNVVKAKQTHLCILCGQSDDVQRLLVQCRVNVFVLRNIFIPEDRRCCRQHLNEKELIREELLPQLQFVNRRYVLNGNDFGPFLEALRKVAEKNSQCWFEDEESFTEAEFGAVSPIKKGEFQDLFTFCDPVQVDNYVRHIKKKDLLMFLCKLRQGVSDEFLKIIFAYPTRQCVSLTFNLVRKSLAERFVPANVGFASIDRNTLIIQHVTPFANQLYNPTPNGPKAILCVDAGYIDTDKSSNFRGLRQSFYLHKGRHLVKPALVVAPDGYIVAVHGPHFSDTKNNDAAILRNELATDPTLRNWFKDGDIIIVDRGYRDIQPVLEDLGISCKMPHLLVRGQRQFTTEESNESRLVTLIRWLVETRNGHMKSIFKFFKHRVKMQHLNNLKDFYEIAAALINKYHPPIVVERNTPELAREILERAQEVNVVQARVEAERLNTRNGQWTHLADGNIADFPLLSLDFLRSLTYGVFQVNLSPSYVQDKLQRNDEEQFELDEHINERGFLRVRVFSRFRNAARHQIFIAYAPNDGGAVHENPDESILGYYCTCQSGARTLGACAHVTSVLWYLGYARHQPNIKYPPTSMLTNVKDAAGRPPQNPV